MYIINKESNRIEKIETAAFKHIGYKKREHLQEWIATIQLLNSVIKRKKGTYSGASINCGFST